MSAPTNAQPWLGICPIHYNLDLKVEVSGVRIFVRTPSDNFRVIYTESEWWADRKESPLMLAELRARTWRLANDAALELGWFNAVERAERPR